MMASVPDPWTPVQVTGIKEKDLKLGVWGRTYSFGNSPLPTQIESAGGPWLAGPIRLVAQTKEGELKWTEQGIQVIDRNDEKATMVGWVTVDYPTRWYVVFKRVEPMKPHEGIVTVDKQTLATELQLGK